MADIRACGFSPFIIADEGIVGSLRPFHDHVDMLEATNLLLTRRVVPYDSGQIMGSVAQSYSVRTS